MRGFVALHQAVDALGGADFTREDLDATLSSRTNAELARELGYTRGGAGSAERRAYQGAMRNLQRYRQGRNPSRPMMDRLRQLLGQGRERRTLERMRSDGVSMSFGGEVMVSDDLRFREVPDVFIPPEELEGAVSAALAGRWGDAADEMANAWGQAYGLGYASWGDVDGIELDW